MKKTMFVLILALLFAGLSIQPVRADACMPPQLPSSFYGYALGVQPGAQVVVSGPTGVITRARTYVYQGSTVYSLDARAYDPCSPTPGGREGDRLTFTVGGRTVGYGVWHGGTNVRLDLKAQAVRFWWQR